MTTFRQNDTRWSNLKYDGVNTFKSAGCLVTCLAMLCDKLPTEVAQILRDNKLFSNGMITDNNKAASLLGLTYGGRSSSKPAYACVAETNYYAPGTHFIIITADNKQIDPMGLKTNYPINYYSLFRKEDMLPKLDTQLWRYQDEPEVNYAFKTAEDFASQAGGQNRWDLIKIRTKPTNTVEVIKEVPLEKIVYVDKIIEVPVIQIVEKEKIVVREMTVGEALNVIWNKIRGINLK